MLGVDLGPTDSMLAAVEHDNARGYWEQREIYEINKEIMAAFGGTWESPPDLLPGWERSPALATVRDRASSLLTDLFGSCKGRWAWKDPRTSVTLPFWRDLIGEMDYVLCVRHPADVAASLEKRGAQDTSFEGSIALWLHYVQAALHLTQGKRRLILHYEDYFANTDRQIQRLTEFVCGPGVRPSDEIRQHVESFIEPSLWHNRDAGDGLDRVRATSPATVELYERLLAARTPESSRAARALRRILSRRMRQVGIPQTSPE
jgi:hypothetical protein